MSSGLTRSLYYENIAYQNRLVAHERPTYDGSLQLRNSFHRINDEEEFLTAIINWGHYPCIVHAGYALRFKNATNVTPKKVTETALRFLTKINPAQYPNTADAIQAAYDVSEKVMLQFLAYILNDQEQNTCSLMSGFSLDRCSAEQTGQVADGVYGYDLVFYDEHKESGAIYRGNDWYDGVFTPPDDDDDLPPLPAPSGAKSFIYYTDEPLKQIVWNSAMKALYGDLPAIEVWYTELDPDSGIPRYRKNDTADIVVDAQPPDTSLITIYLTAPGPGFISISK